MGGGAGGHMMHPYDLPRVTSGVTFLTLMEDVKSYLENPGQTSNVKIDGINTSFKLVGGEFAVDRGSGKEIDVSGVTLARINERFPPGHGMRTAIEKLLNIFNQALPDIQQELSALGLASNPHFFLNTEYVEGAINAVGYQQDFIAIHGVKAFYQMHRKNNKKVAAQTGQAYRLIRQGLPKTPGPASKNMPASREISYDMSALLSLIDKVQPIANRMGFKLYGPVPSSVKEGLEIDYTPALSEPFEVNITDEYSDQHGMFEHLQGRPLLDWLNDIGSVPATYNGKNYDKTYPTTDGRRVNPYHRDTYLAIMNKSVPVDQMIQPGDVDDDGIDNVRNVINGAVILHATRTMGNAIINVMTSEAMGDLSGVDVSHEGVVIRDAQFHSSDPFKITGEFIVTGRFGAIAAKMGTTPQAVTESKIRKMVRESISRTYLSMFPRKR